MAPVTTHKDSPTAAIPAEIIDCCAFVFDAYGTLFDVHSAVAAHASRLGDSASAVSQTWRTKQLEYSWLRSLMDAYVPFWQITRDALAYALDSHGITDGALADDLASAYLRLSPYPEVPRVLQALTGAGRQTALLSNGSPDMLKAAIDSAGLQTQLDAAISVDEVRVFKPDPRTYQLACDRLGRAPEEIAFFSSNAWDVAGAAHFGFRVVWVNRFGQVPERLTGAPLAVVNSLAALEHVGSI